MLQPGTCSAMRSSSMTWVGLPGARAMHCAIGGSSAGTRLGPPRADDVRGQERPDEMREPVGIDPHVAVGIGDDLAGGVLQRDVAGRAQPAVGDVEHGDRRVASGDGAGGVARPVVDEDDLEVGIGQVLDRREALVDGGGLVVGADHDGDLRPRAPLGRGERRVRERLGGRAQRGLGLPLRVHEAERPVVDRLSAPPPLVGPREHDGAAGALGERGPELHGGDRGLAVLALPPAVGPRLRQQ